MRFPGRNNTSRNSTFEKEGEIASLFLWIFHKNLWRAKIFLVFDYYSFWFLPTFCGFLQVFFLAKIVNFERFLAWIVAIFLRGSFFWRGFWQKRNNAKIVKLAKTSKKTDIVNRKSVLKKSSFCAHAQLRTYHWIFRAFVDHVDNEREKW